MEWNGTMPVRCGRRGSPVDKTILCVYRMAEMPFNPHFLPRQFRSRLSKRCFRF